MKKILLLGILSFVLPASSFACANFVDAEVSIGELRIDDKTDADFSSLSNTHFSQRLVAQPTNDGCLYSTLETGPFNAMSIGAKLFLYIHQSGYGEKIQLNGYTDHGKLFEIRTTLGANAEIPATSFSANLYDASGPAKEMLGRTSVLLRDEQEL